MFSLIIDFERRYEEVDKAVKGSAQPFARMGWSGYDCVNAYLRNDGVLLFGFGPDLLLLLI